MAVIKPNKLPPLAVLGLFGQSYDDFRYAGRISRLIMEVSFNLKGVSIAYDLLQKQEEVIKKLHAKTSSKARPYTEEERQMAYIGFFLGAVYKLTEKISQITKIFHEGGLKDGFNKQREQLLKNPEENQQLAKLLGELNWYDLFRELRTEDTHFGTAILAYGYNQQPEDGYSQLILEVAGRGRKKILTGERYNFDVRKTTEIKEGLEKFVQDWALIMIKKLDRKTTITGLPQVKDELVLDDFLVGRQT